MAIRISARKRTLLVASAATAAVLTASTMAGAHEGVDDDVLHLCVKTSNGQVRVVDAADEDCKGGESAVHLPLEAGDDAALTAFMQELLDADNPTDLVHWNNVAGVPQRLLDAVPTWLADGTVSFDEIEGLPSWLADGEVTFDEIAGQLPPSSVTGATVEDGSLTGGDVEDGSLTGGDVQDGSLVAADLAGDDANGVLGAVTSEKVLDGSLTGRDIANGSINAVELNPVVASASVGPGPLLSGDVDDVPLFAPVVNVPTAGVVMVTGQVQLELTSCVSCAPVVSYQVVRTGGATPVPVSPIYEVQLSDLNAKDVASVSVMDTVVAGAHGYQIRVVHTGGGTVFKSGAVVNLQLLGLTG
jgi:hypothetical protein